MSSEAADAMYSTPVYAQGETAAPVTHRLLVCQDSQQLAYLQDHIAADGLPRESLAQDEAGGSFDERLSTLLESARIGTHLYVRGDESFLWHVRAAADRQGLMDEEVSLFRAGDRRKVYCVHCSYIQDVGPGDATTCAGCGVVLTIRTHFSKRLGAYQGVCLDPDNPRGEGS